MGLKAGWILVADIGAFRGCELDDRAYSQVELA